MSQLTVTKRDGSKETYRADMINNAIERASEGLFDIPDKVMRIISDFELTLYDGITTKELDDSLVIAASQNIKDDPDYNIIAKNLLLLTIYKECMEGYEYGDDTQAAHQKYFKKYKSLGYEADLG